MEDIESKKPQEEEEECRAESELDDEFYETLTGPIRALSLVGLKPFCFEEPPGPVGYLREFWWILVSLFLIMALTFLELGYLMFNENKTFVDQCASIAFFIYALLSGIKMFYVFLNRKQCHRLFLALHAVWPKNVEGVALQIKLACTGQIRLISPNYLTMTLIMVSFFWLLHGIFGVYDYYTTGKCIIRYPYYVLEPFSVEKPIVYKLYFMFCCWTGCSAAASSCAMETVFQVVSTQLGMQYKILCHELSALVRDEDAYSALAECDETSAIGRLNALVKRHGKLVRIVEIVEDMYSVPNGLTVSALTITICCMTFVTSTATESVRDLIEFSFCAFTMLTQALVFSFHGHQIMEESDQLVNSIYNSQWYIAGPRLRKSLIIMMSRCQSPDYVTSMKFSAISLKTFTAIAGKAWSFYTLLRTAYDPITNRE